MTYAKRLVEGVKQALIVAKEVLAPSSDDKQIKRLTRLLEDAGLLLLDQQKQLAHQTFLLEEYQKKVEFLSLALMGTVTQGQSLRVQLEGPPS